MNSVNLATFQNLYASLNTKTTQPALKKLNADVFKVNDVVSFSGSVSPLTGVEFPDLSGSAEELEMGLKMVGEIFEKQLPTHSFKQHVAYAGKLLSGDSFGINEQSEDWLKQCHAMHALRLVACLNKTLKTHNAELSHELRPLVKSTTPPDMGEFTQAMGGDGKTFDTEKYKSYCENWKKIGDTLAQYAESNGKDPLLMQLFSGMFENFGEASDYIVKLYIKP